METRRIKRSRLTLMAIAVTFACADAPMPTEQAASPSQLLNLGQTKKALKRAFALSTNVYDYQVIGPAGGRLAAGGVTLAIPEGALASPTLITMVVPGGSFVQAEFLPHGLQFSKPATLTFDLGAAPGDDVSGAYFSSMGLDGTFDALERYEVRVSGSTVSMAIRHFSGYTCSTGRCPPAECEPGPVD